MNASAWHVRAELAVALARARTFGVVVDALAGATVAIWNTNDFPQQWCRSSACKDESGIRLGSCPESDRGDSQTVEALRDLTASDHARPVITGPPAFFHASMPPSI
jgi:hypothetical protein